MPKVFTIPEVSAVIENYYLIELYKRVQKSEAITLINPHQTD